MRTFLLALLVIFMISFGVIGYTDTGEEGEIEIKDDNQTEHLVIQSIATYNKK
ncbi:hypothetical protein GCM10007216_35460 [Thalassobacillus devorans]|uniref:Uncharacterized protein n=1 Tax=Thalassobacillus devorans TaxID=279813 RepID=A0ABQ1PRW6_9BACI|nr:hypothetical protein [Thalassobacillus devorans]NIK30599.1 hypothetical protein [Thalassobacillus devorans]GGD01655.1 hypothetical protein GCM10007216_35460 [Thalassobacillus devorans]